jgi:hypothetical protein
VPRLFAAKRKAARPAALPGWGRKVERLCSGAPATERT